MMRLSYIFNFLALGGSLAGIWQISSMVSLYEEQKEIIARTLEEKNSLVAQREELNKEHAARYSRERAKNQKLTAKGNLERKSLLNINLENKKNE